MTVLNIHIALHTFLINLQMSSVVKSILYMFNCISCVHLIFPLIAN